MLKCLILQYFLTCKKLNLRKYDVVKTTISCLIQVTNICVFCCWTHHIHHCGYVGRAEKTRCNSLVTGRWNNQLLKIQSETMQPAALDSVSYIAKIFSDVVHPWLYEEMWNMNSLSVTVAFGLESYSVNLDAMKQFFLHCRTIFPHNSKLG